MGKEHKRDKSPTDTNYMDFSLGTSQLCDDTQSQSSTSKKEKRKKKKRKLLEHSQQSILNIEEIQTPVEFSSNEFQHNKSVAGTNHDDVLANIKNPLGNIKKQHDTDKIPDIIGNSQPKKSYKTSFHSELNDKSIQRTERISLEDSGENVDNNYHGDTHRKKNKHKKKQIDSSTREVSDKIESSQPNSIATLKNTKSTISNEVSYHSEFQKLHMQNSDPLDTESKNSLKIQEKMFSKSCDVMLCEASQGNDMELQLSSTMKTQETSKKKKKKHKRREIETTFSQPSSIIMNRSLHNSDNTEDQSSFYSQFENEIHMRTSTQNLDTVNIKSSFHSPNFIKKRKHSESSHNEQESAHLYLSKETPICDLLKIKKTPNKTLDPLEAESDLIVRKKKKKKSRKKSKENSTLHNSNDVQNNLKQSDNDTSDCSFFNSYSDGKLKTCKTNEDSDETESATNNKDKFDEVSIQKKKRKKKNLVILTEVEQREPEIVSAAIKDVACSPQKDLSTFINSPNLTPNEVVTSSKTICHDENSDSSLGSGSEARKKKNSVKSLIFTPMIRRISSDSSSDKSVLLNPSPLKKKLNNNTLETIEEISAIQNKTNVNVLQNTLPPENEALTCVAKQKNDKTRFSTCISDTANTLLDNSKVCLNPMTKIHSPLSTTNINDTLIQKHITPSEVNTNVNSSDNRSSTTDCSFSDHVKLSDSKTSSYSESMSSREKRRRTLRLSLEPEIDSDDKDLSDDLYDFDEDLRSVSLEKEKRRNQLSLSSRKCINDSSESSDDEILGSVKKISQKYLQHAKFLAEQNKKNNEHILARLKDFCIEPDFPVHKQHRLEGKIDKGKLSNDVMDLLVEEGMIFNKKFTADEDTIIVKNWKKFSQIYKFEVNEGYMFSKLIRNGIKLMHAYEFLKFAQFLGQGLPLRPLQSIYQRFATLFESASVNIEKFNKLTQKCTTPQKFLLQQSTIPLKGFQQSKPISALKMPSKGLTDKKSWHHITLKKTVKKTNFFDMEQPLKLIMAACGCKTVQELDNIEIPWYKVRQMDPQKFADTRKLWWSRLYTELHIKEVVDIRHMKIKLVKLLQSMRRKSTNLCMETFNWKEFCKDNFPGFHHQHLATLFYNLRKCAAPGKMELATTLKILKAYLLDTSNEFGIIRPLLTKSDGTMIGYQEGNAVANDSCSSISSMTLVRESET